MRVERYIVDRFAERIEQCVMAHAKRHLRQFGAEYLLSGDDSPLQNIWDEICAQQQGEHSVYWSAYQDLIDRSLLDSIAHLDRASLLALWFQTDDGSGWLFDHHADTDSLEQVSVDDNDVLIYLRALLLRKATDENNTRVNKYLHPEGYEIDQGDEPVYFCQRIVSGGQTGTDRAALDFAIDYGYPYGGWIPHGREAEDGSIPLAYQLTELPEGGYRQRTKRNVEDSDGTLIINIGPLDGGTLATQVFARKLDRPCFVAQIDTSDLKCIATDVVEWLQSCKVKTLNVAGPRESKRPGVYRLTREFLEEVDAMNEANIFKIPDGNRRS